MKCGVLAVKTINIKNAIRNLSFTEDIVEYTPWRFVFDVTGLIIWVRRTDSMRNGFLYSRNEN